MKEYSIKLPDKPGMLADLCEALAEKQINILTATALTATGAVVAIVTDEDSTIVIASAGSGKTKTIVGKVNYLVEQRK